MLQDLRFGLRQIARSPGFTMVAVLTLALGIGANSAIFTLLDQVLLRSLPVNHPEQLARLRYTGLDSGGVSFFGGDQQDYFSYPMYRDLRDKNSVFAGTLATDEVQVGIQWNRQSDLLSGELVSGNYFDVLGVRPAMGRLFLPLDDAAQNSNPVVVLSFNYWKNKLGSDPHIIGQALLINAHPFTVVGVAQPGFHSVIAGFVPQVFFPMMTKALVTPGWNELDNRRSKWAIVVARLKPGMSRVQAEAGINPLWHSLRAEELPHIPDTSERFRRGFLDESKLLLLDNQRGFSPLAEQVGVPLLIVMGMVGLVVLMACVNVSSLLLVRAAGRVREMSMRYALGAGRWQIIRQLLVEGVILGVLGGAVGLLLAPMVSALLIRRVADASRAEVPLSWHPDLRILLFNFGLAFVVSLLFSLAPAMRFLRPDLVNSLKQQTTTIAGGPLRFLRLSVALQIGLSLLLLVGAGLFVRTLHNLRTVDSGFVTDHLLSFGIDPTLAGYKPEQIVPLHRRILQALAAQPGVRTVAGTTDPELSGQQSMTGVTIPGVSKPGEETIHVERPAITPGYFFTLGIPRLAGRDFTDQDVTGKPEVVIVNARLARHYFGDVQGAVGQIIEQKRKNQKSQLQIVGVVGDSRHLDMRDDARATVYFPFLQEKAPDFLQFYVRTWQAPEAGEANIRAAMQQIDSKLVIDSLSTMDEQIIATLSNERLMALLAVSFGLLATLLAAVGLYGVLAYATAQRTREIGIRMALGAQRREVVRMVLRDVLRLAGISIVVTLPISILLSRTLRSQLYGVSPADPMILALGTLAIVLVVLIATLLPARRAASVEPMQALRTE
jgi:putative ABC transport system permease protein